MSLVVFAGSLSGVAGRVCLRPLLSGELISLTPSRLELEEGGGGGGRVCLRLLLPVELIPLTPSRPESEKGGGGGGALCELPGSVLVGLGWDEWSGWLP